MNGSSAPLAEAVSWEAYTTGLLSREIFPGGQTGAHGHDVLIQGGYVQPGSYAGYFDDAQQARFIAETAIDRLTEVGATDALLFKAHEHGGLRLPHPGRELVRGRPRRRRHPARNHLLPAGGGALHQALGLAATDDERYAALAGRAAAEVWLGDWSAAAADAHQVPDDFVFWLNLDQQDQETENHIYFGQRQLAVPGVHDPEHVLRGYYADTGDPRTPWVTDPALPFANAALSGYGPGAVDVPDASTPADNDDMQPGQRLGDEAHRGRGGAGRRRAGRRRGRSSTRSAPGTSATTRASPWSRGRRPPWRRRGRRSSGSGASSCGWRAAAWATSAGGRSSRLPATWGSPTSSRCPRSSASTRARSASTSPTPSATPTPTCRRRRAAERPLPSCGPRGAAGGRPPRRPRRVRGDGRS